MALNKPEGSVNAEAAKQAEAEAAPKVEEILEQAEVTEPVQEPVQTSTSTEVAVAPTKSAAVAAHQNNVLREMEEEGLEGLAIDFNSFPSITLKDGEFNISTGGIIAATADKGFAGRITMTKNKFAVRIKTANEDEAEVVFTANRADVNDPSTAAGAKVVEWTKQGLTVEVKDYVDCFVMVEEVFDDAAKHLEGELVVCSVPKTSIGRLTGFLYTRRVKDGLKPSEFLTHFVRGNKVTGVQYPFYPWDFKKYGSA